MTKSDIAFDIQLLLDLGYAESFVKYSGNVIPESALQSVYEDVPYMVDGELGMTLGKLLGLQEVVNLLDREEDGIVEPILFQQVVFNCVVFRQVLKHF
jgi:hypothetical protein